MKNQKRFYNTKKRKTKKRVFKIQLISILLIILGVSITILINFEKLKGDIEKLSEQKVGVEKQELVEVIKIESETIREVTAYNLGDQNQNWGDPCVGASNKNLCEKVAKGENICAANFVPFGTRLQIIADNGWEMTCVVEDRMNSRYSNRVDIAMNLWEKERALKFGVQRLTVRILGDSFTINK